MRFCSAKTPVGMHVAVALRKNVISTTYPHVVAPPQAIPPGSSWFPPELGPLEVGPCLT